MKIKGNKLVVLASTLIIMMGCENDLTEVREMAGKNTNTEVGTQIDSYLSLEGKMKAHLTAPTIIRYVAEGPKRSEFPKSLHVDFFNDSNKLRVASMPNMGTTMKTKKRCYSKKM